MGQKKANCFAAPLNLPDSGFRPDDNLRQNRALYQCCTTPESRGRGFESAPAPSPKIFIKILDKTLSEGSSDLNKSQTPRPDALKE